MYKNILFITLGVLLLICLFYPKQYKTEYFDPSEIDPQSHCLTPPKPPSPKHCAGPGEDPWSPDFGKEGKCCDGSNPIRNPSGAQNPYWLCQSGTPPKPPSPKQCPAPCQNGGTCNTASGKCVCVGNWSGDDCSQPLGPPVPGAYKIQYSWAGSNFGINKDWSFYKNFPCAPGKCPWTGGPRDCYSEQITVDDTGKEICCTEPTHGSVCYGEWNSLLSYPNNQIKIDVGSSVDGGKRKAIRLNTNNTFNGGLFIIDLEHIPQGAGVWPSIWLTGDKWPEQGEIDIIEGVSSQKFNATTLHTSAGCDQSGVPGISNANCNAGNGNIGCGVTPSSVPFGNFQGGVFVCEWIMDGPINVWYFPKNSIPADITSSTPNPTTWDKPYVSFKPCPGHFKDLRMIINTTLCGDWAGAVYKGVSGNCSKDMKTADLSNAYWLINSIKVYQKQK